MNNDSEADVRFMMEAIYDAHIAPLKTQISALTLERDRRSLVRKQLAAALADAPWRLGYQEDRIAQAKMEAAKPYLNLA